MSVMATNEAKLAYEVLNKSNTIESNRLGKQFFKSVAAAKVPSEIGKKTVFFE